MFLKRVFLLILGISLISNRAAAIDSDSNWYEPSIGCAVGAVVGYSSGSGTSNQGNYAMVGCAAVGLIMYGVNSYYSGKSNRATQARIKQLEEALKLQEKIMANNSANGDKSRKYSIMIQEVVPAQKFPDGTIIAPTIKESLEVPSSVLEVGY